MKSQSEKDIIIDYYCQSCGEKKSNKQIDSMVCECGGDFRPDGSLFGQAAIFEPHYCPVLRTYLTSYSQQEKLAVEHRSPSHPEGLRLQQWDRKQVKEYKNMAKNKEDYKRQEYGKHGYKTGSKWSDKHGAFVKAAVILMTFLSTNCFALEGVDYITFKINGIEYDAPIPNKETRQLFRELR